VPRDGWQASKEEVVVIDVRVLDIQPHPDQATNNPGCWAVRFEVSYNGTKRSSWRWHTVRATDGRVVRLSTNKNPTPGEIVERFWTDTFAELHGFAFDKAAP
jgi:hypothetical protein